MGNTAWVEIEGPGNHRVLVQSDGSVVWEHDCPPGYTSGTYAIRRHQVDPAPGETWQVLQAEPLTLHPSLDCSPGIGGCGVHGWIRDGRWHQA
jgi:hypothetical protein